MRGRGGGDVMMLSGGSGVMLTAPHAAAHRHHTDPTRTKPPELRTDEIVRTAAEATGAAAMWTEGVWDGNANSDTEGSCTFKSLLLARVGSGGIRITYDIHGMTDAHGPDVCIGTAGSGDAAAVGAVTRELDRVGLTWTVDLPFNARRPGTVTATLVRNGHRAVQLELARRLREPGRPLDGRLMAALVYLAAAG